MRKWVNYILFIFCIFFPVLGFAQNEVEVDTTVQIVSPPPEYMNDGPDFSPLTQQDAVDIKKVSRKRIEELKSDDDYWYANQEPEKEKQPQSTSSSNNGILNQSWFLNLLWIIILCSFIGVVVWYLASSNISLFRRAPKRILDDESGEEIEEDIHLLNYEKEIQKAVAAANYRLAVRLWYLRTLKELADRNVIEYRHEKTNSDYLLSLFNSRYYRDFFRLTRNFEYTWYGQFPLSAEGYEMMRTDFANFKNGLS